MPKRTKSHDTWLIAKLVDSNIAANYVSAAIEDSPEMFLQAVRNVAEAHGMSKVAEKTGLNRESLYRALSPEGNPTLNTLRAVLTALGLKIDVSEKDSGTATPSPTPTPTTTSIPEDRRVNAASNAIRINEFASTWTSTSVGNVGNEIIETFTDEELIAEQVSEVPIYLLAKNSESHEVAHE